MKANDKLNRATMGKAFKPAKPFKSNVGPLKPAKKFKSNVGPLKTMKAPKR